MSDVGQSETSRPRSISDIDAEHFDRRARVIRDELRAIAYLYLSPYIKERVTRLRLEIDTLIAERKAGM